MKCNILRSLYIKSNGDIRCDDDYGERILLGKITEEAVFSPAVLFSNEHYTEIRVAFAQGLVPWGETCEKCALLANGVIQDSFASKHIEKIQIEPSLHCSLLCLTCSRINQIREGRTPLLLSKQRLSNFLQGLVQDGYTVGIFEFCGQGEPLNHPEFAVLCKLINEFCPDSEVTLITNANFNALEKLQDCHLDEITVSCDGAKQASYEIFRVNGSFEKCIAFMRDAKSLFPTATIIWKYIVFEHNDSDEELALAQTLAEQVKVDKLNFICTQYGPVSQRFTKPDADEFPLISRRAALQTHPYVRNMLAVTTVKRLDVVIFSRRYTFVYAYREPFEHHIDRVTLAFYQEQYYLYVDGWYVPQNRLMQIFLKVGALKKTIQVTFSRADVSKLYQYPYLSGFRTVFCLGARQPKSELRLQIGTCLFDQTYAFDYLATFCEDSLQREPLVQPIKIWKKQATKQDVSNLGSI